MSADQPNVARPLGGAPDARDDEKSGFDQYVRDKLPEIIRLVTDSRLHELELEDGELSLLIRRARPAPGDMPVVPPMVVGGDEASEISNGSHPNVKTITAPMVGTFYHSEQPGRAPLIEEGSPVEPGALIGVIEALQVLTEVESDTAGVVQKMVAADGEPVEYGQPLVEVLIDR